MSTGRFSRSGLRVFWGPDSTRWLAGELDRLGVSRPAVVCTPSVARDGDLIELVRRAAGRDVGGVVAEVRPHSPAESVEAVAARLVAGAADGLVVVGGGSAMVTARAANILRGEGGDLEHLATYRDSEGRFVSPRLRAPKLPTVVLPTTPTTAVVKAGAAVTGGGRSGRRALLDPGTRARSVIVDPLFTAGAPEDVVRNAGLNALVMAFEGLTTRRRTPFSGAVLGHAVRTLPRRLDGFSERPSDSALRVELTLLSLMVGDATDSSGGGATAVLSHAVGHDRGVHNGAVDAILLPHVLGLVYERDPAALLEIAEALGCTPAQVATEAAGLLEKAATATRLRDIGVGAAELPAFARRAMEDFAVSGVTFALDEGDLEEVLLAAL
ncbi:iron-containing alcohol dehydrogenase family protein [Spirillospora sp. CA-255316]